FIDNSTDENRPFDLVSSRELSRPRAGAHCLSTARPTLMGCGSYRLRRRMAKTPPDARRKASPRGASTPTPVSGSRSLLCWLTTWVVTGLGLDLVGWLTTTSMTTGRSDG